MTEPHGRYETVVDSISGKPGAGRIGRIASAVMLLSTLVLIVRVPPAAPASSATSHDDDHDLNASSPDPDVSHVGRSWDPGGRLARSDLCINSGSSSPESLFRSRGPDVPTPRCASGVDHAGPFSWIAEIGAAEPQTSWSVGRVSSSQLNTTSGCAGVVPRFNGWIGLPSRSTMNGGDALSRG